MAMNENQSSGMDFESKEIRELHDSSRDIGEAKDSDEIWNHKVVNKLSMNVENETVDSPVKEVQNGVMHSLDHKDLDSLPPDMYDKEKEQTSGEHLDSFQMDANAFADKRVLDLKEIDHHHIVKDICVDEGKPEKGNLLISSGEDDKLGHVLPHCKAKEDGFDNEISSPDKDRHGSDGQTFAVDASNYCHVKDSEPAGDYGTTDSSEAMDKKIPFEEFGPQSLLKSLLKSLDGEEDTEKQCPTQMNPQIAEEATVPQSLDMALANEEAQADIDSVKHNDKNAGNLSDKEGKSHDVSANNHVPFVNAQATEADAPKHESWTSNNPSSVAQTFKDDGETSFSAASLINYSEPVPFSGSISHRSDSSATSARSFAFPVLQSEWNSSPVRMAKADRRRLRKPRCWSSGLFCCRF